MISNEVKSLFRFIDFLYRNKNKYMGYIPLINELLELKNQRRILKPNVNYKDKQKYNEIQKTIIEKFSIITDNICSPIKDKLIALKIWSGDDLFESIRTNNIIAVRELTENFTETDIKEIQKHKSKYLIFRKETNNNFINLGFMFDELDDILKILFDYFKDVENNEFEQFERKEVIVNDIGEAVKQLKANRDIKVLINSNLKTNMSETIYPPSQESSNIIKEISITATGIETLINKIKPKFSLEEQSKFEKVIKGENINGKIQFKGKAIEFSRVFSPMLKDENITTTKIDVINWIVKYFHWTEKNVKKDFNVSTLIKHFDSQSL